MILIADKILSSAHHQMGSIDDAILIRNGAIAAIDSREKLLRKHPRQKVLEFPRAVLMPGLVNVHAHLELPRMFRSAPKAGYVDWVFSLIKKKRRLTLKDYHKAASTNIVELIRTGTTTVADISTHGASTAALLNSGVRAVIYHEVISMADELPELPDDLFRSGRRKRPRIRQGISPHSPHTVSPTVLRKIEAVSSRHHLPLSMHVAESQDEVLLLRRKKNELERLYRFAAWDLARAPEARTPIEYLQIMGILSPNLLLVHAVHADESDIKQILRSGSPVAHCPRSNQALSVGTMPLKRMLDAEISVGLGTDSLASVPSLSLWDEMRFAFEIHRRSGVTARDILQLATLGGARCLGLEHCIGSIEPGKQADIIAVPLPKKHTGDLCADLLRETKSCVLNLVKGKLLHAEIPQATG